MRPEANRQDVASVTLWVQRAGARQLVLLWLYWASRNFDWA